MTQSVEASREPRPAAPLGAGIRRRARASGSGSSRSRSPRRRSSLHQLMAWAPHEDETLALFVGRDSLARCDRARHPRARRRAAALPVRLRRSPISAAGSAASDSSRRPSPSGACRSWRFSGGGSPTADGADRDGARGRKLGLPLPRRLRTDVQPLPLPLAARVRAPPPRPRPRHAGAAWALWGAAILLTVAAHPTARSSSPRRRVFVLARAAGPSPAGDRGVRSRGRRRHPVLAHGPRARRALRRRRRRRRRQARRAVGGRHVPVADRGRLQQRRVAGARRRPRARARRPVRVRPETRVLALCVVGVPVGGLPRRAARRLHLARVAPPHLRAPVLRDRSSRPASSAAPARRPWAAAVGDRPPRRARGELGLAPDAPALQLGAEQAAGDAGAGRALPRRDEPPRRHPVRVRAALPRRLGAEPRLPRPRRAARRRGPRPAHARPRPEAARARCLDPRRERAEQPPAQPRDREPRPRATPGCSSGASTGRSSSSAPGRRSRPRTPTSRRRPERCSSGARSGSGMPT